jgi:hypothetical protein
MILASILDSFLKVAEWLSTLLPGFSAEGFNIDMQQLSAFMESVKALDTVLPVSETISGMWTYLNFYVVIFTVRVVFWIYHQFWGSD